MLEPREYDIPVLFLVLVVLPLVAYIILGKWSEATKKRYRITLLAHLAAEQTLRTEEMAIAHKIPTVSSSKIELHDCARCSAPARTRCSKCKSVRYCSGNCQIIHWRQIHKQECQPLETHNSSSVDEFNHGSGLCNENLNSQFFSHSLKQNLMESSTLNNMVQPLKGTTTFATVDNALFNNSKVFAFERRISHKSSRETPRKSNRSTYESSVGPSGYKATSSPPSSVESKETIMRQKMRNNDDSALAEATPEKANMSGTAIRSYKQDESRSKIYDGDNDHSQYGNAHVPRKNYGPSSASAAPNNDENIDEFETGISTGGNAVKGAKFPSDEEAQYKCPSGMTVKGSVKAKMMSCPPKTKCSKPSKLTLMTLTDLCYSEMEKKEKVLDEPKVAGITDTICSRFSNGTESIRVVKRMGLRKSTKLSALATSGGSRDNCKKIKMLFPYEEFIKIFQGEVFGILPRGLLNCGNSCYASAVLQCLTSTKPLVIYLFSRSHSKSCTAKDWCLMCELEQHIMIMRENEAPLSPSRILCHIRSLNCLMGDGKQEDAHEFLRLLIASMQSICLEGLGGEKKVDPRLQDTTFIQHTFGGHLQSKVKCLNCNHESERYENIMDLTLEILGCVESLEDALTQFTSLEDLDGENMYRCERCTEYVQARKQLSIHEAPNILTIVLKRFQEGRYGKINKCVSFPEMLDMVPFMTGTGDIPPLYMLYAVVVHLDTLNASFSGHYISYVKDLQGNWFRIDDTEVQPVLVSQVMSEGAYILFYMRSSPRPAVAHADKAKRQQIYDSSKHSPLEAWKKSGHCRNSNQFVVPVPEHSEVATRHMDTNRNVPRVTETCAENTSREFLDAKSSDWSLFTSSDEASFTTESTRDSFRL